MSEKWTLEESHATNLYDEIDYKSGRVGRKIAKMAETTDKNTI